MYNAAVVAAVERHLQETPQQSTEHWWKVSVCVCVCVCVGGGVSVWGEGKMIFVPTSIASFPGSLGGGERAWYPLFVHALNHHEISWLPDTTVRHSRYADVIVMISLVLAMAACVPLFEHWIT